MLSHRQEVIEIVDDDVNTTKALNPGVSSSKFPFLHSILQRKYESKIKLDLPKVQQTVGIHIQPLKKEQQVPQISNLVRVESIFNANLPKEINSPKHSFNVEVTLPKESQVLIGQKTEIKEVIRCVETDTKEDRQQVNCSEQESKLLERQQSYEQRSTMKRLKGKPLPDILTVQVCLDPIRLPSDMPSPCFSQDESPINKPSYQENSLSVVEDYSSIVPVQSFEANRSQLFSQEISAERLRQNKMSIIQKYLQMQNSQANNLSSEQPEQQVAPEPEVPLILQVQKQSTQIPQQAFINQEEINENPHIQQNIETQSLVEIPAQITQEVQIIQIEHPQQEPLAQQKYIQSDNIVSYNSQEASIHKANKQIIDLFEIAQQNSIIPSIESSHHNITSHEHTNKQNITSNQLDQIKKKIVQFLPDLEPSIQSLSIQELQQIYNKVKDQLSKSLQSENLECQIHQQNQPLQVHDTTSKENQNPQSSIIQPVHKPIEHPSDVHPFYTLLKLDEQDLRNEMVKHFPQAKDSIMGMNESQLRDLLNESLAQIQKQTNKGENSTANNPKNNHNSNNNTSVMRTNDNLPSIQQMKTYLTDIAPKMQRQIEQIGQNYIKQIYKQAIEGASRSVQNVGEVQHSIILKMCLQKLPSLAAEIGKLSKQQLTKVYQSLKAKLNSNLKTPIKSNQQITKQVDNKANPKTPQSKPLHKSPKQSEPTLKRTHETMMSTNPKITQSKGKKKSIDIRTRLLKHLPDLKGNIMKLGDKQIEKIFKESLDPQSTKKIQRCEEIKPVIVLTDKKFAPELAISQQQLTPAIRQQSRMMSQVTPSKTQPRVIQLQSEAGRKKSRTFVLIHTEDIDQEQLDKREKSKRIGEFSEKKWNCQCLNSVTIPDLIHKLTELIDKKTE